MMERFKNILVVVDSESPSQGAMRRAVELAKHNHAKIKIVDVLRELGWLKRISTANTQQLEDKVREEKTRQLAALSDSVEGVEVSTKLLSGNASTEIVREVLRGGHDLVMKEAKGAGWHKGYFGRTAIQLLRQCPCAVWLTNPGPHATYERVLAAVDAVSTDDAHAQLSRKILNLATSFCRREGARLDIIQVWSVYGESLLKSHMRPDEFEDLVRTSRADVEKSLNKLLRDFETDAAADNVHVLAGEPGTVIPDLAKENEIDLVVMGTVARTGITGALMGNTAETTLGRVQCSVLALKPEEFSTPIQLND